ncbi:hypothetical protein ATL42_1409 [Sanguibacter antarcticus]|uniref:YlxR domain-containing protein n=1 Tax=Sanguibacter antarcticus TaxID=372484 RepID=A0A2A9E5M7_9MICO|nr:YlxR family protein [Sanguibacter antarcticus]PFG33532.1 hypothetical protein ATL42_1409 [Sanguibacter antarcticus]
MRTCVGCRERDEQTQMIRFVIHPGDAATGSEAVVVADLGRTSPGRGAWLHPSARCGELALKRKAFPRALRAAANIDLQSMTEALGSVPLASTTRRQGSGSEADGHPMSTQR